MILKVIIQIFYDKSNDSFRNYSNASYSTFTSESDDNLGDLCDARQWAKLSSVPENISAAPSQIPFVRAPDESPINYTK